MDKVKKVKALEIGDTIGIVSPASGTNREEVDKMKSLIESYGFKVKMGKSPYEKRGYLSGDDKVRAEDINNMFEDKEVDGIFCARGGYGSPRILDLLDYELISNNPKVFLGYSDITALHTAFNQLCNMVTFHGPMGTSDMIHDFSEQSKESLLKAVMKKRENYNLDNIDQSKLKVLSSGKAEGKLVGGNLSLIADTIGTKYALDTRGKILFLEEIEEEPRNIDRMLNQLRLSGLLDNAEAIILGNFKDCLPKKKDSLTLDEVFNDYLADLNKPVVSNFQAGHCEPTLTLPFMVDAVVDTYEGIIKITENSLI